MASSSNGRDHTSTNHDEESPTKRRASFNWPPMSDPRHFDESLSADGSRNSVMWMGGGVQMPILPQMGMVPLHGYHPMMLPMPNAGDARQLEAYKAALENAMLGNGVHPLFAPSQSQFPVGGRFAAPSDIMRSEVPGSYPADSFTLREHILYENELFDEFHEGINDMGHFWNMVSLLERYFRGALSASARPKILKMVQSVIDDRSTSVDESRRLKHVMEALRTPGAVHNGPHVDESYLQQLTAAHKSFVSQHYCSGKVK